MSNKLIVKDPFEMPAVDDTTVLVLRECADLVPHCWIWNESVGYLEVVTYSGYDIYVTVKNTGVKENATSGTIFPSCMEFLITAPNATPIIDNTVTCLRADFKCPTVGQEALMSVDSTSAIRVGDIIIVDTRYQYLVTEIINEHTMKVLNEEKGKEGGVIDVKCNECVPVKILESTHCCEALQDQVDDIYSRIDTKKSIIPDADSLISITNGSNSLTDAFNDVVLDVDIDLSKYDNSVSKFTSLRYFKETTSGVDAFFSPDRSTGYTNYDLGTNTNYFNNAYINKLQGGQGRSSFISFPIDGSDTMYSNGTAFSYNAHAFYSGGKKLVAFAHDEAYFYTSITPNPSSTLNLGLSGKEWNNIYTDSITLNGTTYTSIPTVNDATLTIQKNGTSVGTFTANASSNSTVNITVPTDTSDLTNGAGYITSASLPTVNDAKLTIYESDGVTPFVEFTANASSAVTATLPSSGSSYTATAPISIDANNDISISQATTSTDGYLSSTDWNTFNSKASSLVYFEEYHSGSVANWQPKSGSATYFDLGYPGNGYTTAYIDTVKKENSYFTLPSDGGDITINCGTGGTYHTNYGDINFNIGNGNKLNLQPTQAVFNVNVVRNSNSNLSLGINTNAWYEGWIQFIKTNQLKTVSGSSISVQADLNSGSNGSQSIGNNYYFNTIHGETVKVKYLTPGAGNVSSIEVKTADNTGTIQLISNTATRNIGTSSNNWSNGYFANLYGTDCFFNNVEPRASGNTGYVGKNTHYYSQMHCTTLQQHSDRKDKENIIERNSTKGVNIKSLDKINSLKTYTYNFKEGDNVRTHLGMMADEVYKVEPLCASLLEDDTPGSKSIEGTPTGIDIGAMITLLLEGIKELSSEVKELKSKLGEKDANSEVLEK